MIELRFFNRGKEIIRYNITKEEITIGRSLENDICLPSLKIAPNHLRIYKDGPHIFVIDVSQQGFFLNKKKVSKEILKEKDKISLGSWNIYVKRIYDYSNERSENIALNFKSDIKTAIKDNSKETENFSNAYIEVLEEDDNSIRYLIKDRALIGSDSECDIRIQNDPYVSRIHAEIYKEEENFLITDLDSSNGTYVNNVKVYQAELFDNAKITLGNTELRFKYNKGKKYFPSFYGIIGESQAIKNVIRLIESVAREDVSVLLLGESGVGKEVVARAIHNLSLRNKYPFIAINCGAINEQLIESILFGHEEGAFTGAQKRHKGIFEQAGKGTLFLDEIGELPLSQQVKLLRVLETGEFTRLGGTEVIKNRARIIAATNRDLQEESKKKNFREDLFYRLNIFNIRIPPLRKRDKDVVLLAEYFLHEFSKKNLTLSFQAAQKLMSHSWPGNVRELKNVIQRAVILAKGNIIQPDEILLDYDVKDGINEIIPTISNNLDNVGIFENPEFNPRSKQFEKNMILKVLEHTDWNVQKAAEIMNMSRSTLYNKLSKYEIPTPRQKKKRKKIK